MPPKRSASSRISQPNSRNSAKKVPCSSGDVHPGVAEVAGAITPVPGGVGPLTIAMLMSNTVKAARLAARARGHENHTGRGGETLMLRVGLTGGIATGKSTVAAMLRELGCHVLEADKIAHRMIEPGAAAYEDVVREFGRGILVAGWPRGPRKSSAQSCLPIRSAWRD